MHRLTSMNDEVMSRTRVQKKKYIGQSPGKMNRAIGLFIDSLEISPLLQRVCAPCLFLI